MTKPMLDVSEFYPTSNPYEGGRLLTTVNCPVEGCAHREEIAVSSLEGLKSGSVVVMHTANEHWTRVYFGSDASRAQYSS